MSAGSRATAEGPRRCRSAPSPPSAAPGSTRGTQGRSTTSRMRSWKLASRSNAFQQIATEQPQGISAQLTWPRCELNTPCEYYCNGLADSFDLTTQTRLAPDFAAHVFINSGAMLIALFFPPCECD